jgi:predicted CXXCH cytochrome family protein
MVAAVDRMRTGCGSNVEGERSRTPMIKATKNHLLVAVAGVFALAAVGCVSESSTPAAITRDASFVGYSNPDTKQTTCGNCHVDVQNEWKQTKHANAWADMQATGHANASCNKCHTTSGLTSGGDSTGFFTVSADAQKFYQDVQCEACHGAGANHIGAPGETQPVQLIMSNDTTHAKGCASCHYDTHNPFSEQLAVSKHGTMPNWEGPLGSCQVNCHSGYGAMAIYNPRFTYTDQQAATALPATTPGITCSVCHDPHDATNPGQTRLTLNTTDSASHLCGKCHNRGPVAGAVFGSWKSSRGGHSAQFATLMGTSGYQFTNTVQGPARHGTIEGNCATCHVNAGPVNTAAGAFAVQNTGHTFMPAPCLDPTKLTTGGVDVTESCAETARDFSACATGGCHGTQASAADAMKNLQDEIMAYANVLWVDSDADATLDTAGVDGGWIPRLLRNDSRFAAGAKRLATTGRDTVFTVAKAARFNILTLVNPTRHGDGSIGVHNPAYVRSMLQQTISQVWAAYGASDTLPPAPAAVVRFMSRSGVSLAARR